MAPGAVGSLVASGPDPDGQCGGSGRDHGTRKGITVQGAGGCRRGTDEQSERADGPELELLARPTTGSLRCSQHRHAGEGRYRDGGGGPCRGVRRAGDRCDHAGGSHEQRGPAQPAPCSQPEATLEQEQCDAQCAQRDGGVQRGVGDPAFGEEAEHGGRDEVDGGQPGRDDGQGLSGACQSRAQADRQGAHAGGCGQHQHDLPDRTQAVPDDRGEHCTRDDQQQRADPQEDRLGAGRTARGGSGLGRGSREGRRRHPGPGCADLRWAPDRVRALDLGSRGRIAGSNPIGEPGGSGGQRVRLGDIAGVGTVSAGAGDHAGCVMSGGVEVSGPALWASHRQHPFPGGNPPQ